MAGNNRENSTGSPLVFLSSWNEIALFHGVLVQDPKHSPVRRGFRRKVHERGGWVPREPHGLVKEFRGGSTKKNNEITKSISTRSERFFHQILYYFSLTLYPFLHLPAILKPFDRHDRGDFFKFGIAGKNGGSKS